MRDGYNEIIREGDTLLSCYGIPPTRIEAKVVKRKKRLVCETPGHNPESCYLSDFCKSMGDVYITKRKYE